MYNKKYIPSIIIKSISLKEAKIQCEITFNIIQFQHKQYSEIQI